MGRFKRRPQGGYWDYGQRRVVSRGFVSSEMSRVSRGRKGARVYITGQPSPPTREELREEFEELERRFPSYDSVEEAIDAGAEQVSGEGRSGDT